MFNPFKINLTSSSFKLNGKDLAALVRNSLVTGAVAALAYFGTNLHTVDFGEYTVIIAAGAVTGIDALIKFIKGNEVKLEDKKEVE